MIPASLDSPLGCRPKAARVYGEAAISITAGTLAYIDDFELMMIIIIGSIDIRDQ